MKGAIFCLVVVAAVALARPGEDHYTDKYDNVNIHEVISNPGLYEAYVKCILDLGRCTPDGKELKSKISDALETNCSKCTPPQKEKTKVVIKHMINKDEVNWNKLKAKYDPTGKYSAEHEKELREAKD